MAACLPLKQGWQTLVETTIGLLFVLGAAAWCGRLAWLAVGTFCALRQLPQVAAPEELRAAAQGSGVRRLRCLHLREPVAFCSGLAAPTVFASTGLPRALRGERLRAVLVHEQHHARRLEPLRRLAAQAAADVLFFLPIMVWWARRRSITAELAADRAAMRAVGRQPVAAALLTVSSFTLAPVAGFAGAVDARVRQLLGEPQQIDLMPRRTVALSAVGLGMAASVALCAARVLLKLLG